MQFALFNVQVVGLGMLFHANNFAYSQIDAVDRVIVVNLCCREQASEGPDTRKAGP